MGYGERGTVKAGAGDSRSPSLRQRAPPGQVVKQRRPLVAGVVRHLPALGGQPQVQALQRRRLGVPLLGHVPQRADVALVALGDPLLQPVGFRSIKIQPRPHGGPFRFQLAQLGQVGQRPAPHLVDARGLGQGLGGELALLARRGPGGW